MHLFSTYPTPLDQADLPMEQVAVADSQLRQEVPAGVLVPVIYACLLSSWGTKYSKQQTQVSVICINKHLVHIRHYIWYYICSGYCGNTGECNMTLPPKSSLEWGKQIINSYTAKW